MNCWEKTLSMIQLLAVILMLASVAASLGCISRLPKPLEPRFFLVLLDETESFAHYDDKGQIDYTYWPEVIPYIVKIVDRLEPEDAFGVIGIDECGFEEEDMIVPITILDERSLVAKFQKDSLKTAVKELTQRKQKHRSTHILGALYHAAHFASRDPDRRTIILCFSDMKEEPAWPTAQESADLRFPKGTEGYFFYVDASGRRNWDKTVYVWMPILAKAGLQIHTGNSLNFFQRGESNVKLDQVLGAIAEQ